MADVKLDGVKIIEKLRDESPETEYVISTGHGSMDDAIRAIRMGAYDFLPKPVTSLAAFQEIVLSRLPPERQPQGPRIRGRADAAGLRGINPSRSASASNSRSS